MLPCGHPEVCDVLCDEFREAIREERDTKGNGVCRERAMPGEAVHSSV